MTYSPQVVKLAYFELPDWCPDFNHRLEVLSQEAQYLFDIG